MPQYYTRTEIINDKHDITLSSTYVPNLPNTGFEPTNGFELAFALVVLIAVAIILYPYVRKAFAIVRS